MHTFQTSLPTLLRGGLLVLLVALVAPAARAHPLSQGSLDVTVLPAKVAVRARVTPEEVSVTNMLVAPATGPSATPAAPADAGRAMAAAYDQHARYLAAHVHVSADGRPLAGRVAAVHPPAEEAGAATANQHAVYEIEYAAPGAAGGSANGAPPAKIELRQDVLVGVDFLPGTSWEATYVVRISQHGGPSAEGMLLTGRQPITFDCDWRAGAASPGGAPDGTPAATVDRGRVFREYLAHGVRHILVGYDHLLFISALVLGAARLWDLVKVVTAFTLAHTITLTLAALRLVHLPEHVVEPMIAGSIVFVAVQNVFWPSRSRGWGRLAAAFFFGLFHGLGFAGGLLDAMQEMGGATVVAAILAFSVGVELGHQMIVLPLFAALTLARSTRDTPDAKERVSVLAQRIGSAFISVAGVFYLVVALWPSFSRAS